MLLLFHLTNLLLNKYKKHNIFNIFLIYLTNFYLN